MQIGPYQFKNNVIVAPMAGVTDRPFRQLCRRLGAGLAVSEMVTSDRRLWKTEKSRTRLDHHGEPEPRSVQIAGADPQMMAEAARLNVERGAQIIDINIGCPAKKVCNRAAGSALLKDEPLVASILEAVVAAVDVPVTLKMRTGWDPMHRNGIVIARLAQSIGIRALAVHGRTRACGYKGAVEYDTIRAIKESVKIPVIANGDINSAIRAKEVLAYTGADAIMIGRAAQGNPWIFGEIEHYLKTGTLSPRPSIEVRRDVMLDHVHNLHAFYGEYRGVRIARKHIGWYLQEHAQGEHWRRLINKVECTGEQLRLIRDFFDKTINENLAA